MHWQIWLTCSQSRYTLFFRRPARCREHLPNNIVDLAYQSHQEHLGWSLQLVMFLMRPISDGVRDWFFSLYRWAGVPKHSSRRRNVLLLLLELYIVSRCRSTTVVRIFRSWLGREPRSTGYHAYDHIDLSTYEQD